MKQIKLEEIVNWQIAKKTKNIKAKPALSIMVDKSVLSKFLINTLEGRENLGDGSVICLGESNDIWQQMPKKLLQKYNVIEIDKEGWMVCEPRPDNSVECFEIIATLDEEDCLYIDAQWGESMTTSDGVISIQRAEPGDFICRNREDKSDCWIVKRKIFINTYNIIN
jgi:hypothetical protein